MPLGGFEPPLLVQIDLNHCHIFSRSERPCSTRAFWPHNFTGLDVRLKPLSDKLNIQLRATVLEQKLGIMARNTVGASDAKDTMEEEDNERAGYVSNIVAY